MASKARYTLLADDENPTIRVDLRILAFLVSGLPVGALFFCIVYSVLYDFDSSTRTLCQSYEAYNVLPSVSAAIGGSSPQKEVWKIAIFIHSGPRFVMIYYYVHYNFQVLSPKVYSLVYVLAVLNFIENVALLGLSFFDSFHSYPYHEKSFIIFVLASEFYMLLVVFVQKFWRRTARTKHEVKGLRIKIWMVSINIIAIFIATYYFIIHNTYCIDYAYTKFAICEYIVVLSNVAYHLTAIEDFYGKDMAFSTRHGLYLLYR